MDLTTSKGPLYVLVLSCNLGYVTDEVNALERYQLYFDKFERDDDKTFLETISGQRKVAEGLTVAPALQPVKMERF